MDTYGLLGYPLGHSFSRNYFGEKFQKEGLEAEYLNFEIPTIEQVPMILDAHPQLKGMNVTIPYKQQVMPYLNEITPEAQAIGAVNVVRVSHTPTGEIRLKGYNSDVIGFTESLKPLLKPHHTHALILGTGGASKAVHYGLQQLGLNSQWVSRRKESGQLTYDELTPELMQQYTVIVNCTPCGMYPKVDTCPDIPYHLLSSQHLLYDLTYNPDVTLFMKKGQAQRAATKNGLEMLILQAEASWRFWHE